MTVRRLIPLFGLLACSGDGPTDTTDSGPTDTGTPADTVALTADVGVWPDGTKVAGAEVCWRVPSGDRCATTGPDGGVALEVLAGETGQLTFEGPPLPPTAMPLVLADDDVFVGMNLDSVAFLASLQGQVGLTPDPSRGTVSVYLSNGIGGATLGLTPTSGQGPYHLDGTGLQLDPAATSTAPGMGVGYFFDVDPAAGPFELSVTLSSGGTCEAPDLGAALAPFEVWPGFEHVVGIRCD